MASVIRGDDNFDSQYGAALKAWVNFNGAGTVAIREALNVSSITDNGTGSFTLNFANAMPDTDYAVIGSALLAGNATLLVPEFSGTKTVNGVNINTMNAGSGGALDATTISVAVLR